MQMEERGRWGKRDVREGMVEEGNERREDGRKRERGGMEEGGKL